MLSSTQIKNLSFREADKQLLEKQIVDENNPGSILRDFKCLIDYIKSNTVEATKTNYQFSLKHLAPINERLTHPIKLKLSRPQNKSFPNICGLYLILRSTGIVNIGFSGKKPIITIDETILRLWNSLNPTERYFTLLESWLIRGQPKEILAEHNPLYRKLFHTCYDFWKRIPAKGLKIEGNEEIDGYIAYLIGYYNISLLELFGFLEIQYGEPETGKGWRVLKVKRLAFGDAVFRCVFQIERESEHFFDYEDNCDIPLGQWQLPLQSFFPEWQNNLTFPENEFTDGNYIFKVSLENVWRRIAIHSEMTFEDFANIILESFEFDKDHLYSFYYTNRFGMTTEINCPQTGDEPLTSETRIGEIPIQVGSFIKFLFDFGDNWEFDIFLEKINPVDIKLKVPRIIEEHGEPPSQYPDWDDEWDDDE